MVTDNTLDLVVPTNQGKHLPQSQLQGTKRDRAWLVYSIGPDVFPRGYQDGPNCLPSVTSLTVRAIPDSYSKPQIKT